MCRETGETTTCGGGAGVGREPVLGAKKMSCVFFSGIFFTVFSDFACFLVLRAHPMRFFRHFFTTRDFLSFNAFFLQNFDEKIFLMRRCGVFSPFLAMRPPRVSQGRFSKFFHGASFSCFSHYAVLCRPCRFSRQWVFLVLG